jgi:hypothetical protein
MNTTDLLRPLIEAQGGVLLDSADGELLLLDRFVRGLLPLPRSVEPSAQDELFTLVDRLYSRGEQQSGVEPAFTVHAAVEDLCADDAFRDTLSRLLGALAMAGPCDLTAQFSRPPADWLPFLRWLHKTLSQFDRLWNHVSLRGPFEPTDDTAKEGLFHMGVRAEFVTGWWDGYDSERAENLSGHALRDLARFGLRVPLVCYVHAGNVGQVRSLIEEGLELNEHSGFALPLVFHHPHYRFAPGQPAPPDAEAYRRLLAEVYNDFPCFDELFYPVNELARLVGSGGWIPGREAPARVNLLATPAGGVGMFRLIPAFARGGVGWEELARVEPPSLAGWLLDRHAQEFSWEANPFCDRCSWRYVCGGADGWDGRADSAAQVLRVACEHRKEFLDLFVREKAQFLLPGVSV